MLSNISLLAIGGSLVLVPLNPAQARGESFQSPWSFRLEDVPPSHREPLRQPFSSPSMIVRQEEQGTNPYPDEPSVAVEVSDDEQYDSAEPREENGENSAYLPLQVTVGSRRFRPVLAELTQTRLIAVNAVQLAQTLADLIDDATSSNLVALGDRLVDIDEIAAAGVSLALNPGSFEITAEIDNARLRARSFQVSGEVDYRGAMPVTPSNFAFGLTAATEVISVLDGAFDPQVLLNTDGFVNVGGVDGVNLDFGGRFNISGRTGYQLFERGRLTLFKDWTDRALRAAAGDVVPIQARLAGSFDLLGFSLTRNYEQLQPTRNIRPTADRRLVLEERSIVEVYVNGIQIERFVADAGPIDLNSIAVNSFGNEVTIVVEDSFGRREVDAFRFTSDIELLAEGIEQFSFSVGLLRDLTSTGFSYTDAPVASAYYERGISNSLTLAGHAVASDDQVNAGAGFALGVPIGIVSVEAAASYARDRGAGYSLAAVFRGAPFLGNLSSEYLTASFEYRSEEFAQFDTFANFGSLKYDLRLDYQVDVRPNLSLFANTGILERYGIDGADRFASAGFRTSFGPVQLTVSGRYSDRSGTESDIGVLAGITVPVGRRGTAAASYDSISNIARADFRMRRTRDLPEIDYRVGVARGPDDTELFGDFGFANTRFETTARVQRLFRRDGVADTSIASTRFQTGLAYADGVLAIGRDPGRGFAIVSRHPSIEDAELRVLSGAAGRELAIANGIGPAVVPLLSPYRPQTITVEAANLPPGYDLGAGEYVLVNGARSGLSVELGSADYRTAIASLTFDGEPVSLAYGTFRRADSPDAPLTAFFTNRQGRGAFANLGPGRYQLEIGELGLQGSFVIEADAEALVSLGTLELQLP